MTGAEVALAVALALTLAIVGFQSWLLYLLIREHGQALIRRDAMEARLTALEARPAQQPLAVESSDQPAPAAAPTTAPMPAQPQGLPIGSPAPEFALRDLKGRQHRLSEYLGDRRLLLVFFNPDCGFCTQLAPNLNEIASGSHRVLLLSRGDRLVNRRLANQHHWTFDVLLEDGWTVASSYQTNATPTAYLVDSRGHIASSLAIGAPGIQELVKVNGSDLTVEALQQKEQAAQERARAAGLAVRESTIQRDGLATGTVAPNFTLPALQGGEQTLADYTGKRVLLVFSDPNCGPCQTLAPQLEQLQRNSGSTKLQVLMISRGDRTANLNKVQEYGVTFPVLLQNGWEVSREYAMFATPIGYLIDERGVIVKDVAIGADAVIALAAG